MAVEHAAGSGERLALVGNVVLDGDGHAGQPARIDASGDLGIDIRSPSPGMIVHQVGEGAQVFGRSGSIEGTVDHVRRSAIAHADCTRNDQGVHQLFPLMGGTVTAPVSWRCSDGNAGGACGVFSAESTRRGATGRSVSWVSSKASICRMSAITRSMSAATPSTRSSGISNWAKDAMC